jgi:hypothetical protein
MRRQYFEIRLFFEKREGLESLLDFYCCKYLYIFQYLFMHLSMCKHLGAIVVKIDIVVMII